MSDGSNRKAIVFGHSTGLGRAITNDLLGRGYEVVGVARSHGDGSERLTNVVADLSTEQGVQSAVDAIAADHGEFDVLVYATGALTVHDIDKLSYSELEHVYRVNTFAPMVVESALFDLIKANEADVINITSSSVVEFYPKYAEYSSSKAAFTKFTSDLQRTLKDTRCRVMEFCPSGFTSNLYNVMSGEHIDRDESIQMRAEDLAEMIGYFLQLPKKIEIGRIFVNRK